MPALARFRPTRAQARTITFLRRASVPLVLVFWLVVTELGLIPPLYLPQPIEVFRAAQDIGLTNLLLDTVATMARLLIGYGLGVWLGIRIGLAMGSNKYVEAILFAIVESWRPVPPVALLPFFTLWFAFAERGKILLTTLGVLLLVVVETYEAVRKVRPIYRRAAYSLGADDSFQVATILKYAIRPGLVGGLRVALATGFGLVFVSEFMGASSGLGYRMNLAKVTLDTAKILLGVLIIGLVALFLDGWLRRIMRRLTSWSERLEEAIN